ncbi:MAG: hypothetical protein JWN63_3804, partial [Candidatus Acidoferrum typicum]|nr:hypothetical protein [Candidatus Acidoferrum typicum]
SARSACARGQANIALSPHRVTQQKCRVSHWWHERVRSRWRRDFLRPRVGDRSERPSEHENGYEQAPNSRCLSCQTNKAHLFSSSLVIFSVDVVETHSLPDGLKAAWLCRTAFPPSEHPPLVVQPCAQSDFTENRA